MEFFRVVFKTLAALLGLPLTLGGFVGFWYGIYTIFAKHIVETGIALAIGSVIALSVGTILGKYSRGDFD
ncbi:hypothetical protein [uncultured Desulfobacter sp.]|uniref:hypothetical protein n=1 Tax=uncultured Desulfobacter sp. TaxID=240139 RepID=UPI0029F4BF60|nr:hypothetical protein [uncultured Desulfobacter sp.]